MSKYPFTYTIQGYDFDEEDYYLENGVGICESFSDATSILEKRFGNDLIAIKHLELYADNTVIALPRITFEEVVECLEQDEVYQPKCDVEGELIL
jgi:hypothetical protein